MNIRSIPFAAAAVLLATGALAQVKTDGQWRGLGGASLATSSGNTTSTALLLNTDMARATTADKITLGGSINYAKAKINGVNQTTANRWGAAGQYDYNLSPQLYAFGKLGLEADRIVDLQLRNAIAGGLGYHVINTKEMSFDVFSGVGYHVINTKEMSFDVFGGVGYTTDKYRVAQTIGGETGTRFSRASLLFGEESSHQFSPTVSAKQRLEVYPGLSGDKANLMKFTAGLGVAMSSTLNLTVGVVDSYNSKPPAGLKKNDLGVFTGVSVKLGAL